MSMSTICAIATAQGGAIGLIRVSGPKAISITDGIFKGKTSLENAKPYTLNYGHIIDSENIIDEVLVSVFHAPNSYTGEDSIEISCHGSTYILQHIIQMLIDKGCRMANPGEYTQRAFMNGKMDLSQAEAVADIIASNSASAHRVAMTQLKGGFSHKLRELRDKLLELSSYLELELDFSDHEELEFVDRIKLIELGHLIEFEILHLSNSFSTGNAIKQGIPVAIIGAPNVGKSTLLNLLLQEDKAIVSNIQGTTRDVIEDTITINGILFRFIDTAGIRKTEDEIEKIGISRSLNAAERAQIILLMTEPGVPYPEINVRDDQKVINIINKSDSFQALGGLGLDWLQSELIKAVPAINEDSVLVTNIRHKQSLDLALQDIRRAIESLHQQLSGDIIAEDLRQCIHNLSTILGDNITSNTILG
ncbi:MAG: tRNA uridine-5-carboxymethylaminomethyl(34) synthesis GTPase MnmE, partial [Bacteroidaceae bacterium]|nr:tRNA uridine-5-carboxymethylaminomethyl(34) synthesis GTPase MnmE [Bacteroidaceae bacterium]